MEGDHVARLTSRAVLAALAVALVALAAALALFGAAPPRSPTTALGALPADLAAGRAAAVATLGALLLALAPVLRLGGLALELATRGDRRAAASAALALALLLVSFVLPHPGR